MSLRVGSMSPSRLVELVVHALALDGVEDGLSRLQAALMGHLVVGIGRGGCGDDHFNALPLDDC